MVSSTCGFLCCPRPLARVSSLCIYSKRPQLTDHPTGVKDFSVSLDTQTADVTAEESLSYETVLEKIKKTGKQVNSGEADGVTMTV
jgi:hypothetical protein